MRTKTLLLLCLLLGIGMTQLSAQLPDPPDNKHGTGVVSGWKSYNDLLYPVFCNDEMVDVIEVDLSVHWLAHFVNFNFVFAEHNCKGVGVSVGFINEEEIKIGGTGEVFKLIDIPHKYDPYAEYQYELLNFIGNQGTHYVSLTGWENNEPYGSRVVMSNCPGNKE